MNFIISPVANNLLQLLHDNERIPSLQIIHVWRNQTVFQWDLFAFFNFLPFKTLTERETDDNQIVLHPESMMHMTELPKLNYLDLPISNEDSLNRIN